VQIIDVQNCSDVLVRFVLFIFFFVCELASSLYQKNIFLQLDASTPGSEMS